MKWEEKFVSDVCEFNYGKSLPESKRIFGEYPVYGSAGIVGYHNDYVVKGPGIIVGRKGTVGVIYYEKHDFFPIDTTYFVTNKSGYDLRFLYYLLKTLNLTNLNSDAAIPGLNRNVAYEQKSVFPPLPVQQKIVSILSAYDDLIENNLNRIKLLEEKATIIFNSITETSKTENIVLKDIVTVIKGKKPNKIFTEYKEGCLLYLLLDTVERTKELYTFDLTLPLATNEDVLMCMDGARSGISFRGMYGAIGSTMAIWRPTDNRINGEYLYHIFKNKESYIIQGNTGAAIPHANKKYILDIIIPVLSSDEFNQYKIISNPILELIRNLQHQNGKIYEARDILLPNLMNGELKL